MLERPNDGRLHAVVRGESPRALVAPQQPLGGSGAEVKKTM